MPKKKDKESYEIEVFKSGTHTDSAGNVNTWTDDDLDEIVALYNEQGDEDKHTAPLVIGHPKDNKPAVGWIQSLKKVGSKLLAVVTDLSEEIKDSVNKGEYKKVSISLYPSKLLRHIGLLGAMPPAVKGLADVEFSEVREKQGYHLFEYEDVETNPSPDDALKAAQAERQKKYGITAKLSEVVRKEEIVELRTFEKPEQYAAIDDEMFADPVNYRFPIDTKANFLSSLSLMREYRWRDVYNDLERATLQARMVEARDRLGITDQDHFYLFSEQETESPRKKRADKHKIKIVEGKGHDTVPEHYSELAEEEFADPVNLRFPIAKKYLLGSLASWSRDAVRSDYSDEEQVFIAARIIKAAEVNKINLTPYKWAYVDVDPSILNRKQLLTILENRNTQPTNNSSHKLEFSMNEQIFSQFIADLTAWATEALGEDVATQMSAKITELSEKLMPAEGAAPPSDNSEGNNPEIIALRRQVEILQKKDRANEHNSFTESLIKEGKMLPAQRKAAMDLLEATHASTADFSESEKNVSVSKKVRDFMGTYPQIVDFGSHAGDSGNKNTNGSSDEFSEADPERIDLHTKTVAKAKELAAQRGIADYQQCYSEALRIITTH